MNNQSTFVKATIWFMVFLMSVGFAALVIAPFAGTSLIGGNSGRDATEKLVTSARADVERDNCADESAQLSKAQIERCKESLKQLASAYTTLASPEDGATEMPRDAQRNIERAGDAFQRLYELDKADTDNAALYAGYLRDAGKTDQALKIWTVLVRANPKNEDYLLQQAGAYQQKQDTEQTIKTLQLYVKRFPDSGQLQNIKDQIKTLRKQEQDAAAASSAGGDVPINVS